MPYRSYRYRRYWGRRRYGRRKRSSGTVRAIRKVWYSWPSRFSRRLVGSAVSGAAITGFRTAWWLAMRMGRSH